MFVDEEHGPARERSRRCRQRGHGSPARKPPGFELGRWHAFPEPPPLSPVAAHVPQQHSLAFGFHALGHDLHAELVRHGDDGTAQRQGLAATFQPGHEAAVDLHSVDGVVLQVAQ